jgi:hypothetical protein
MDHLPARNSAGRRPPPLTQPSTRAGIWRCAPPMAPRQLPPLTPPDRAIATAGANSRLDKTWGQRHSFRVGQFCFRLVSPSVFREGLLTGRFCVAAYLPRGLITRGSSEFRAPLLRLRRAELPLPCGGRARSILAVSPPRRTTCGTYCQSRWP